MALRKILTQGDEQLLKRSRKVEKFDARLHTLIDDMRETLTNSGGVGLAAPQVGVSRRLIAVQRFDKPGEPFECYVNPEIVGRSAARTAGREGCLSVPETSGTVLRADRIVLRYLDETTMRPVTDTVEGFTAVIFQHEIDHLDGVLFIDRMQRGN